MAGEIELTPEMRASCYSKTMIGIVFFLVSFALSFLSVLLSLVPCMTAVLGLGAFGALIVGFVLMIIGARAFSTSHKFMIIISLVGLIVLFITSIFIGIVGVFAIGIGSFVPGKDMKGEDVIDFLKATRTLTMVTLIPAFLTTAMYSLPFFGVSKMWGKVVLVVFLVSIPVFAGTSFVLKDQVISDKIDSIDPDEKYTTDEFTEVSTDLSTDMYVASLINEVPMIIIIIAVIGSLLNVDRMRKDVLRSIPPKRKEVEQKTSTGVYSAPEGPIPDEPRVLDGPP